MGSPRPLSPISTRFFRALLLAGLAARLAVLPLAGTEDVNVWKTWSYAAVSEGVSRMYGVGGTPPVRAVVSWGERRTTVDYPPVTLYGLALAGRTYLLRDPGFRDSRWLTVFIKMPGLIGEMIVCAALFLLLRRVASVDAARTAVLFYWLNPAIWLNGAVLGYLDPWTAAPAMLSVLAAVAGLPMLAGALVAIAALTKAQGLFIAPVTALALWRSARLARVRSCALAIAGAAVTTAAVLLPYVRAGALPNVVQGVGALMRHDMLSGTAANLWWVMTWIIRASYATRDLGAWAAWTRPVRILGIRRVVELGYLNPRPFTAAMVIIVAAWAIWRARRGDVVLVLAAGALAVHAYFVLAVQVHENHLYLAVPLLAGAAAARPSLRGPFAAVSAILAANLYLFYGLGRDVPLPPRTFTVIDATVIVAALNVVTLAWHASRFAALPESVAATDSR